MNNLQPIQEIQGNIQVLETSFIQMSDAVKESNLGYSFKNIFEKAVKSLVYSLIELEALTYGDSKTICTDLLQYTKNKSRELRTLQRYEFATNGDLAKLGKSLYIKVKNGISDVEKNEEVKYFVENGEINPLSDEVISTLAKMFKSKNEVAVFEEGSGQGEHLLTFREHVNAPHVHLYGSDLNVEDCKKALDKGIDKVAKGGLHSMTPHCFDIALFLQKKFTFEATGNSAGHEEVVEFGNYLRYRSPVKNGGYLIFNLPYFQVKKFFKKLMNLKIVGIYRTDDEFGNLIFISTPGKADEVSQKQELKRAIMLPDRLPHYTDVQEIILTKELTLPEKFRGQIIDGQDHLHLFKDEQNPQSLLEDLYKPTENTVELNNPLQEYRVGHLSAIAPTGITNGIYDTHLHKDMIKGKKMLPHVLKASLVRREVATMTEETKGGKVVPVISIKKTSELKIKTMTPDGRIVSLLEKISIGDRKNKATTAARKNPTK